MMQEPDVDRRGGDALFTAAEMRAVDAAAIAAGTPGFELMRRAGEAVADRAAAMAQGGPILVLCGPGNNGGDGHVAAAVLAARGCDVRVLAFLPAAGLSGDAARAAALWTGPVTPVEDARPEDAALVVDALFGTGLARDLDGPVADAVARMNAAVRPVLSVDIPSGIDADTGGVRGVAIRATATLALAARKPGHLLYPGRAHAGMTEMADIGLGAQLVAQGCSLFANGPARWSGALPRRSAESHKYDRGHALVVSGGPTQTGAARLAARGALRAGAGLVSLVTSARALSVNAAHLTAIMLKVADEPDELSDILTDDRFNAVALGPALGVGETARAWVAAVLEADRATVLDADALTSFSGRIDELLALIAPDRERPVVLTPHEGEFARLFAGRDEPSETARAIAGQPSKLERARQAAALTGAIVVLKGPDSVVAAPDGRAVVNANGSPHLATAGSGDVLGGIATGLMAQGMAGFEAACAAVWMHAEAARRFGPGLIAEDLPETMPAVLREFYPDD